MVNCTWAQSQIEEGEGGTVRQTVVLVEALVEEHKIFNLCIEIKKFFF